MSIVERVVKHLEELNGGGVARCATLRPSPRESQSVNVDLELLTRTGCLIEVDSRSLQAQQFRDIKRPLLRNARSASATERMSLIMVTSPGSGEGKTFCAINLAMSMAIEVDTAVLLVDADVVRPDLLSRLGLQPRKGLLDLLADSDIDITDVLLRTNVANLSILPAGSANSRSTEILASSALDRLLAELAVRLPDHVVIFDAPPLLLTTEAKVLATRVGQVLMVIEAGRTPRNLAQRAFAVLDECAIVMTVLNKGREPPEYRAYGDYYG